MKRISIILSFVLIPVLIFAQINDITGYKLMYSKLNEQQLNSQLQRINHEIGEASLASVGGVALTGLGALSLLAGFAMITAEPWIELNPDEQGFLFPMALIGLSFQYVGGVGLMGSSVWLGITGVGLIVTANGNIAFQLEKKHQIQLEMKSLNPSLKNTSRELVSV